MKKNIITFTLIAIFSIGLSLEANAATQTFESCTEENAHEIQREQRSGWFWTLFWGSNGYFQ